MMFELFKGVSLVGAVGFLPCPIHSDLGSKYLFLQVYIELDALGNSCVTFILYVYINTNFKECLGVYCLYCQTVNIFGDYISPCWPYCDNMYMENIEIKIIDHYY